MKGKYSPTVSRAYQKDQNWFGKYAGTDQYGTENQYDPEGYDSYGYNQYDLDRAGKREYEYQQVCGCCGQEHENLFWQIRDEWSFDGIKPIRHDIKSRPWQLS